MELSLYGRTDKELRELAMDIADGKVFGTFCMSKHDLDSINIVFMPVLFMDEENKKRMEEEKVIHFYEYYDKSLPQAINGMPCFMSFNTITQDEWEKLGPLIDDINALKKEFTGK